MMRPPDLVTSRGGRYAHQLGIDPDRDSGERFKWFVAALLYGARISETLAGRAWKAFAARGVLTPQRIVETGWDGLVAILDAGGYARYDHKTAAKLLAVCDALLRDYRGDLDVLHATAAGPRDLEARLKTLGKGIGDITVGIFLRELRAVWAKADPPLSPPAVLAAETLGYLRSPSPDPARTLARLRTVWRRSGRGEADFPAFESALVREGLRRRRAAARHRQA